MYTATIPSTLHTATRSLRLAQIQHLTFGEGNPYPDVYKTAYSDLLELYGVSFDEEIFGWARRNSFTEMATETLRALEPLSDPVDLIILAHMTPDAEPGYPICFLGGVVPGDTLGFAVSDQGVAAPFTALRVADGYMRTGAIGRALVIVLDQSTIQRTGPLPKEIDPKGDAAVAMIVDEAGALGAMTIHQETNLAPREVQAVMADYLTCLPPADTPDAPVIYVLGRGIVPLCDLSDGHQVVAPAGLPCSGLWSKLAGGLPGWSASGSRVVTADYDRSLRYLSICVVDRCDSGGAPKQ